MKISRYIFFQHCFFGEGFKIFISIIAFDHFGRSILAFDHLTFWPDAIISQNDYTII